MIKELRIYTFVFFVSLTFLCSCDSYTINQKASLAKEFDFLPNDFPKIYLNESEQFVDFQELNKKQDNTNENEITLNFSDQIVFSSKKYFLDNKDKKDNLGLLPLDEIKTQATDYKFQSQTLCTTNLNSNTNKIKQNFGSMSLPFHTSIIELIPLELLRQSLNGEVMECTFIFYIDNKQHVFLNKRILPLFSGKSKEDFSHLIAQDRSVYRLSLIKENGVSFKVVDQEVLTYEDIKKLSIINYSDQKAEQYELFCNNKEILSISYAKDQVLFSVSFYEKIKESKERGTQDCHFVAVTNNKVVAGITKVFKIDFDSLANNKRKIDVSEIDAPVFKYINRMRVKRTRRRRVHLTYHLTFEKLEKLSADVDYSSIDLIVTTKCITDTLSLMKVYEKETRLPLDINFSVMAFMPKEFFSLLSITQNHKVQNEFINEKRGKFRDSQKKILNLYCLYTVELIDTEDSSNTIKFDEASYKFEWGRDGHTGYGIKYENHQVVTHPELVISFNSKNWKNRVLWPALQVTQQKDEEIVQLHRYTYEQLVSLKELRRERIQLGHLEFKFIDSNVKNDKLSLLCYSEKEQTQTKKYRRHIKFENFDYLSKIWSIGHQTNTISLDSLFGNPEVYAFTRKKDLIACRVVIYTEYKNKLSVKYFSPEMKFTNNL